MNSVAGRSQNVPTSRFNRHPVAPPASDVEGAYLLASVKNNVLGLDAPSPVLGRFRLRRRVGAGASGVVFLAEDRTTGEVVALKTLRANMGVSLPDLVAEFRHAAAIDHPNLVALYELEASTQLYYVMEYVSGPDCMTALRAHAQGGNWSQFSRILRDVAAGLQALHAAGIVHCDVKPANVLVENQTRPVVLDFGLALSSRRCGATEICRGSPPYVAPERASDPTRNISAAVDAYALGMMGAIACGLAVDGTNPRADRCEPPSRIRRSLDALCRPDPDQRAPLSILGGAATEIGSPHSITSPPDELRILRTAADGPPQLRCVSIEGPSGSGKTRLVEHFVDELKQSKWLTLRGRCYENERTPFGGLDQVVEGLVDYLVQLDEAVAKYLLESVDPELRRVSLAFPAATRLTSQARCDSGETHLDLATALKRVLHRIAGSRRVAVVLDDLHWGTRDMLQLIEPLARPPYLPEILWVTTRRRDHDAGAQHLAQLHERGGIVPVTRIRLESAEPRASCRDAVSACISALPDPGRRLLEVVAVAAGPIPRVAAVHAAGVAACGMAAVRRLRFLRLLRTDRHDRLDCDEPRIRNHVLGRVAGHRRRLHRVLAESLYEHCPEQHGQISWNSHRAGLAAWVRREAPLAAAAAARSGAHHQAAAQYRLAARYATDPQSQSDHLCHRAESLARARQPREAAEAYLAASALAGQLQNGQQRYLVRQAAHHLLACGELDRGEAIFARLLPAVGLSWPTSPSNAIVRLFWYAWRLRSVGNGTQVERTKRTGSEPLNELWSVVNGIVPLRYLWGAALTFEYVYRSRRSGDPKHLARGLALYAATLAMGGSRREARVHRVLASARAAMLEIDDVETRASVEFYGAVANLSLGRRREAVQGGQQAERELRKHGRSLKDLAVAGAIVAVGLRCLGELDAYAAHNDSRFDEVWDCGDRVARVQVAVPCTDIALFRDQPDLADYFVSTVESDWSQQAFCLPAVSPIMCRVRVLVYLGREREAWDVLANRWPKVAGFPAMCLQLIRIEYLSWRGRCAAAMTLTDPARRLRRRALNDARRLMREGHPGTIGAASAIRATLATGKERLAWLRRALSDFESHGMQFEATAVRLRLWQSAPQDPMHCRFEEAVTEYATRHGILNMQRAATMVVPDLGETT